MDARGPTSESTEGIILCIGVALTLSLSTAGQVRTDSRKKHIIKETKLTLHVSSL